MTKAEVIQRSLGILEELLRSASPTSDRAKFIRLALRDLYFAYLLLEPYLNHIIVEDEDFRLRWFMEDIDDYMSSPGLRHQAELPFIISGTLVEILDEVGRKIDQANLDWDQGKVIIV